MRRATGGEAEVETTLKTAKIAKT